MGRLSADIQSVVDLAKASDPVGGLFQALLVILENAPDRSIIAAALEQISPETIAESDHRQRAANLLLRGDRADLARAWLPEVTVSSKAHENVVPLRGVEPERKPVAVDPEALMFADIGGMEQVKDQVRRKIIKPFQTPALFKAFRKKAGGGVLMYGPPGCGKTMLARALANECEAQFMPIRAADVLDMYVGVPEKRIAELFRKARASKPTVMFFDEVEALAQRRQFDAQQKVNTTVSVLLSEMDGATENNDGILFLGATNLPWSLDSAFRRPGRFDRTLFVPPPDRVARKFILQHALSRKPHDASVDIEFLVEKTPGFSGADLGALVDAAIDFAIEDSTSEILTPLNKKHFAEALKEIRSSTGEWLSQAKSYSQYANQDGLYDDLKEFLDKYGR